MTASRFPFRLLCPPFVPLSFRHSPRSAYRSIYPTPFAMPLSCLPCRLSPTRVLDVFRSPRPAYLPALLADRRGEGQADWCTVAVHAEVRRYVFPDLGGHLLLIRGRSNAIFLPVKRYTTIRFVYTVIVYFSREIVRKWFLLPLHSLIRRVSICVPPACSHPRWASSIAISP